MAIERETPKTFSGMDFFGGTLPVGSGDLGGSGSRDSDESLGTSGGATDDLEGGAGEMEGGAGDMAVGWSTDFAQAQGWALAYSFARQATSMVEKYAKTNTING